jgi:hypothetical protein
MYRQSVQRRSVVRRSRSESGPKYVLGVDIGLVHSRTTLVLVQEVALEGNEAPEYHVKMLKRFPAGTKAPDILDFLVRLLARRELESCELVVDATGVGLPIIQQMERRGLRPRSITITGATKSNGSSVPKQNLVSGLLLLLQQHRLKIPADLKLLDELLEEFDNFDVKYSSTGRPTYAAASGSYDDLLMALSLATYRFENMRRRMPAVVASVISAREDSLRQKISLAQMYSFFR